MRSPQQIDKRLYLSTEGLPLDQCLAKTYIADNGRTRAGRTVSDHCHIVGEVAREIIKRMPYWLRTALFPEDSELIAALHDIGKISPTFQEKIYRGTSGYSHNSKPGLECANPDLEKNWGGHAGVSMAATDQHGGLALGKFIPKILGQHHGYLPHLGGKTATSDVFGGQAWQEQRAICVEELKSALHCSDWPIVSSDLHAMVKASNQNIRQEIFVEPLPNTKVGIQLCQNVMSDAKAIEEVLIRAEQGQQILWIENTVNEAQDKYRYLAAKAADMNIACGLLHSRFLKIDRDRNEAHWVTLFGKDNFVERKKQGRILVGTQVLEQSLDIDADFLITRMCPTDMLLQRLGRLWRHENTWRPQSAAREAWILVPTLAEACNNPEKSFGKSACVYSPYVLYRSLEVWEKIWRDDQSIILPRDIRVLIEETYMEREDTGGVFRTKKELEKKRETLERLALVGLSKGGTTLPENKADTRYSDQDSVEVLLLRSYRRNKNDNQAGTFVTLLSGEELYLPQNRKVQDRREWRKIAAILTTNVENVLKKI